MPSLNRILHVEDDPDIREIVNICLCAMGGFELLQCEGGQQAMDKAEAFAPDLFLFDLMMPGMSGIDTLKALREIPALVGVPAIFCTSVNVAEEYKSELRALSVGAVQKPFDPMTLAQQITDIWNAHHQGQ
ncbi:response regulator [Shimia biformata]|uniref:response regulator n=1 Tax=Shimia biformata TaxID=1294299 RepID=UPI00194E4344